MKGKRFEREASIEDMWLEMIYETGPTVAANPKGVQHQEMKRAFYAGFTACMFVMKAIASECVTQEEANALLKGLSEEATKFAEEQLEILIVTMEAKT